MHLSLNDRLLSVKSEENEMNLSHKSQLKYFGFIQMEDINEYIYTNTDLFDMALKVIDYLKTKKFNISMNLDLSVLVENNQKEKELFVSLKTTASDFKNGIYDNTYFVDFCDFLNSSIKRKLRPHQIKAAYHHYLLKNAADFSVPGSGKTTTLLSVYEKMRVEGIVNLIFMVGPPSSFSAWKNEFVETLGRKPKFKILTGSNKEDRTAHYYNFFDNTDLVLTSFQSFANDYEHIAHFFKHSTIKAFLVVDEAHYIKRIDGKWANAVLFAGKHAVSKHVLTGTPCPKSYTDLFNLFDLLWSDGTAISDTEKARVKFYEKREDFTRASELIKKNLDPLFFRVRKSDLGLTEPIFHPPILVEMNEIERKIYDAVYKKISEISHFDGEKNVLNLLALKRGRIIRLRQLTSYAKLLSSAITDYDEIVTKDMDNIGNAILHYNKHEIPAKFTVLNDLIKQIRLKNNKVLIWSNFIDTIDCIEDYLKKEGLKCNHIYGSTPVIDLPEQDVLTREKIIAEFLKPNSSIDILIANPGACAESISLHKGCHNAIYYDMSYNCAHYLQSLDRIHRVGGSETIESHYYFLQYVDTIDSDILSNLIDKRDKMYSVIEYDSDIYNLDVDVFMDTDGDEKAYDRIFRK